jgi:hypothetical protein
MKSKVTSYNKVKTSLAKLEKKTTGTLITRDVSDVVTAELFVTGSEYLETLLVVVPKRLEQTCTPPIPPLMYKQIGKDEEIAAIFATQMFSGHPPLSRPLCSLSLAPTVVFPLSPLSRLLLALFSLPSPPLSLLFSRESCARVSLLRTPDRGRVCCEEHGSAWIRQHAGLESYETLGTENVVPRSSEEVQGINDKDSKLYTVTLFKRSIDDFKMAAREAKFVVKDFTYDEGL